VCKEWKRWCRERL